MKYTIENVEALPQNCFEINLNNDCFHLFKQRVKQIKLENKTITQPQSTLSLNLAINFDALNLGKSIYGSSKAETKVIQKENVNQLLKLYRTTIKILRYAKTHLKNNYSKTLLVENLDTKQNNNHKMLEFMINTALCTKCFKKTSTALNYACEYLDIENGKHNMCDFKDNRCAKHRARDFKTTTGCCPKKCKFMCSGPCKTKNISCKLIMCDYLENKGFYFSPNYLGVLRTNLTIVERLVVLGLFFKSDKKVNLIIWLVRTLGILCIFALLKIVLGIII